ncbi:hypothetical protein OH456_06550 [Vibrio sp. La 4.2.2]|uniref:hypothetical protein n=1 Tax=Vibrio sp. La 4.2.2 TaxID=2998830 RepID=UPI0022CDE167|nr:hypothetical protein [Vibrio sp. La 4.2.2]MDA0107795.1 hypothetical protein [Vibrio sp. La 4.2.2]
MSTSRIIPEKITHPMQLMAAWFVMLVALVSILLAAAAKISKPDWAAGYLVISSTILIAIVIICVFLMLTKFRPNLQDSEKYAVWLKDQNKFVNVAKPVKEEKKEKLPVLELPKDRTPQEQITLLKKARACNVLVVNTAYSNLVLNGLLKEGFSAELYERDAVHESDLRDSTGIWVGVDQEPEAVLRAIELALEYWPQLAYLHLSIDSDGPEDTHDQLFIGGSHSAVKRLKLEPWSKDDILSIPKNVSAQEFHKLIRDKYL